MSETEPVDKIEDMDAGIGAFGNEATHFMELVAGGGSPGKTSVSGARFLACCGT